MGESSMQVDVQQLYTDLGDIKATLKNVQAAVSRLAQTVSPHVRTHHPHVVRIEGVCGGRPIVSGTRISVRTIAERVRLGDSPEQIAQDYPPLTLAKVYDALSYYHEHKAQIEGEMAADEEALAWATNRCRE